MSLLHNLQSRFAEQRIARLIRRKTMGGPERIPGDALGVYKGDTAAIPVRFVTHSLLQGTVWLFDVFQAMPPGTSADGPEAPTWVGNLVSGPQRVDSTAHWFQKP